MPDSNEAGRQSVDAWYRGSASLFRGIRLTRVQFNVLALLAIVMSAGTARRACYQLQGELNPILIINQSATAQVWIDGKEYSEDSFRATSPCHGLAIDFGTKNVRAEIYPFAPGSDSGSVVIEEPAKVTFHMEHRLLP